MLTITKLKGAEYLITSVAQGLEDYYMGAGEAPGVWRGSWAADLGLEGVVSADDLRAMVNGHDPASGVDLLAGHRERKVRAIDVTLSVPKSVSMLWAFGSPETSAAVARAVVEATDTALQFLEERAAVARVQEGGIRRRVGTEGFAVATFAHRTSRAGDPQLHTHCLILNIVRRADGVHVAFDANPLHVWGKATGTVFLNQLQRTLTQRLGIEWGPERNGSREMIGFTRDQLRAFSKRTQAIEARLEARGELAFDSKKDRMRADDRASKRTRQPKDRTVTAEALRDRWAGEAVTVGLDPGPLVDDLVVGRQVERSLGPAEVELLAALVDPETGLCATDSRFTEAHVVERIAAMSGGRLTVDEIVEVSQRFVQTDLVVRLAPDVERRRPAEWSTVELRGVEDQLLSDLHQLIATSGHAVDPAVVEAAIAGENKVLGDDQADAVRVLCGAGPSVRTLVAPAGYGKTTALAAAAAAQQAAGRHVVVLAPTHKASAELSGAGLDAQTIARFLLQTEGAPLPPGTTVVVDEMSQVGTRHAVALTDIVARSTGAQVWWIGDVRQAQSVAAGGLAAKLQQLADEGVIPAATLDRNRRQVDPTDRQALTELRAGDPESSRKIRTEHGWEHEHPTPVETRQALAEAAVTDADRHGADQVAVLAVSHADCEDLTDRIRAIRTARGELRGPTIEGQGWGPEPRTYAAGDRILVHTNLGAGQRPQVFNGSTGTIASIDHSGARVLLDDDRQVQLTATFLAGSRRDGTPNVSHGWARTVAGAQGGTWTQAHLLGTPTLDAFTGYVGQSRGRRPTHTWNTSPEADHPLNLLADDRTPGDAVVDAMRRDQPKTLAADHDPWILDRQLRTERQEHAAIAAGRPGNFSAQLDRVNDELSRATKEHRWATKAVDSAEDQRARLGPLSRLHRGGRDDIAAADNALNRANQGLEYATRRLHDIQANIEHYQTAVASRAAWDRTHHWRLDRITEIDHTLARHWADVTLAAVRADDRLAFGVDRLRAAHTTYQADLADIVNALPADRRDQLDLANADLRQQRRELSNAQRQVNRAEQALDDAGQRRWGRRDNPAIEHATAELHAADVNVDQATRAVEQATQRVTAERDAVATWTTATQATGGQRRELEAAIHDTTAALDHTRPQRVATAALDPTSHLWDTLGPPPPSRGGLAAWCGIAQQLETINDHELGQPQQVPAAFYTPQERHTASLLAEATGIIATAHHLDPTPARDTLQDQATWQPALEAATQHVAERRPTREIDHGLGIGL
jgi:conjugative relaxase-like TrwC/TraI family protein